jgi:hypothetical protein
MKHDLRLPDVFENHLPRERNNPTSFYTLFQADIFSVGICPPAKLDSQYRSTNRKVVKSSHETLRAACKCVMTEDSNQIQILLPPPLFADQTRTLIS